MNNRINIAEAAPEAYKAMLSLEQHIAGAGLDKVHRHLIKVRASQINGCAFCIDMHTTEARKDGETERRLYALSAWRDTPFFTEEEQAILALTEEVTLIQHHVSDETYARAAKLFDEHYLAIIYMTIVTINAWNRISVGTGRQPAL